jgi:hypothetical protein
LLTVADDAPRGYAEPLECCRWDLHFADGPRCARHLTADDRTLLGALDKRAGARGIKVDRITPYYRGPYRRLWPYGPNVHVTMRGPLLDWAEAHDLRFAPKAHTCTRWLTGRRCTQRCYASTRQPTWWDHPTCWTRDGKPAVLISQPYIPGPAALSGRDLDELGALDAEPGLRVELRTDGWYDSGLIILIWREVPS